MIWIALLLHAQALAGPDAPASEAEFRAACSKERPWNCERLAYQLQAGTWGEGRRAEALQILEQTCAWGRQEACGMGLVMARQDADPAAIQTWSERACEASFATACVSLAEAARRPRARREAWERACAAASDWETCSVAQGLRDPDQRGPAPPERFAAQVRAAKATFTPPAGFAPREPDPDLPFPADYLLRSEDGQVEIRYLVLPWADPLPGELGALAVDPKKAGLLLLAVAHHAYTGSALEALPSNFPQTAVRLEFNAELGWVEALRPDPARGRPFTQGQLMLFQREGAGDLLILVLADEPVGLVTTAQTAFHALRFAEPVGL